MLYDSVQGFIGFYGVLWGVFGWGMVRYRLFSRFFRIVTAITFGRFWSI